MQGQFVGPDSRLWQECLDRTPHDFYHMPGYVRLCADQEQGEPLAFVTEDEKNRLLIPLVLRPNDTGHSMKKRLYDAAGPYGYPSPLLMGAENEDERAAFLDRAIEAFVSSLRTREVVSAFLRFHPLFPLPLEAVRRHGRLIHHGQTVYVDLGQSEEEIWRQTRRGHRKCIRRAERKGYVAEIDPEWDHFEEFYSIYTETMERVSADSTYLFSMQYFFELKDALKDALHLCVVRLDDSVACASLYSEICGVVQGHLGGARPEYNKDSPTILMDHYARSWARERGNHTFHMGGGKGGSDDSLFQFKAGFSHLRGDYYTWRAVIDVDRYRTLARPWEQRADIHSDDLSGFFPVYRRPLSELDGQLQTTERQPEYPKPSHRHGDSRVQSRKSSRMHTQLIRPGCSLWQEYLSKMPHDFYHMPGYVRLCAEQEHGEPLAFVAEEGDNRLFVPLILRPIDTVQTTKKRLYDATSPYGYPSPLFACARDDGTEVDFLERAMEQLLSDLRKRGVVSTFLRLHPLLPLPLAPFRRHGTLVYHGETVFADLTLAEQELWHQTRSRFRSQINRARRNGYVAEFDREWSNFDEFFEIYTQTMRRVNADEHYFFPRQYFLDLKDALQDSLHLCVVRVNGAAACAGLYSELRGIVQYHLAGSRPEYTKDDPMKLMMDYARSWAKERGNHTFHLGGGKGGRRDSLFQFKAGFSKLRSDFHTWRAVVDVEEYGALVQEWEQAVGAEADRLDGHFPAYRNSPIRPGGPATPAEPASAI